MSCYIQDKPLFQNTVWTSKSLTEAYQSITDEAKDTQKLRLVSFKGSFISVGGVLDLGSNNVGIIICAWGQGAVRINGADLFLTPSYPKDLIFNRIDEINGNPAYVQYAEFTWDN